MVIISTITFTIIPWIIPFFLIILHSTKDDINADTISSHLYTKDIPDPDLVIRTSNEYRLSNFLPWQSTYSELYFPKDVMWPDFDEKQFDNAIEEYIKRNRRFGGN